MKVLHSFHVIVLTVLISVGSADTRDIVCLSTDGKQINLALRVVNNISNNSLRSGYRKWSSNHEVNEIQSEYFEFVGLNIFL